MMQNSWTNHLAFALHQLVIQVLQMIGPDDASCLPLQDVFWALCLEADVPLRQKCTILRSLRPLILLSQRLLFSM